MTDGIHIPQEDLALFAMQALSNEEQASIRLHLIECALCRTELAEVLGDLALVGMSAQSHPVPQGARARFLERIAAPQAVADKTVRIDSVRPLAKPQPRQASVWIPWIAVAALLLAVVTLGAKLRDMNQELQRQTALAAAERAEGVRAREVFDVLTSPKAQHVLLIAGTPHPAPSARAAYVAGRGALILQASNMKPLDANKTYELWIIPANGAAPIPAGLFRPDSYGSANLILPKIPEGVAAKAFGVTIEDAAGATTPTAPIVLSGATTTSGE